MSIYEVAPEQLAELFHHYHQALCAEFRNPSKPPSETWNHVPPREKSRLIAAARLALLELETSERQLRGPKPYFATPGEAEWGC